MSEEKRQFNILDWSAILISVVSVFIAVRSCQISNKSLGLSQKEILNVNLLRVSDIGKIELTEIGFGKLEIPYWKCIVSNIGNRDLSIISYTIWRKDGENKGYYSGFYHDFGIYDSELDSVKFPIKLDVGESKAFYIRISIPSQIVKYSGYQDRFKFGNSYSLNEISNFIDLKRLESDTSSYTTSNVTDSSVTIRIRGRKIDTSPHGKYVRESSIYDKQRKLI